VMKTIASPHFMCTAALLASTVVLSGLSEKRIPESLAVALDQINPNILGWTAVTDRRLSEGVARQLAATSYLSREYQKDKTSLDLFIAFYEQQRAGESMHSPKSCLPGGGWEIWKHDSATVPVNGQKFEVNKYSIHNMGTRMVMFYWYQSKERIVASEYMAKVLLARDSLVTGRTGGSIVRILLPDNPQSEQEGIAFASQLIPQVQRCFGYTGSLN
jgi:EpsI family protein